MANPISAELVKGTIGELLVQLRLLQFDVQAAPPLKDSGNDLIALRGYEVRTIQVKTCTGQIRRPADLPERYHLVAIVQLSGYDNNLLLDESRIYLVPRADIPQLRSNEDGLQRYALSQQLVDELFAPG